MTDNKIIKALECCQTEYNRNCKECPYEKSKARYISTVTCSSRMRKHLLEFVNRQQAEIAKWKFTAKTNENWHRTAELNANEIIKLQAEITRLTEALERLTADSDLKDIEEFELIRKVRTDTICELAKRLEKKLANNYEISSFAYQSVIYDVSIAANEMIGELV